MQILSPFASSVEVRQLIEAGANELYCGVVTPDWEKRFTYIGSINLRHDKAANLSSFKELGAAVKIAEKRNVPVFAAFNAHFYSQRQMPSVLRQAKQALAAGASGLIIADPILIESVREKFPSANISLSTGQPCFNSSALAFFKQLGVQRIVLPRHLSVSEAAALAAQAKKLGIETECFVLNAICPFIDGLCTFQHIVEPSQQLAVQQLACRMNYSVSVLGNAAPCKKEIAAAHAKVWCNTIYNDCGLCALPFFLKAGVDSVKIAGRANSLQKKLADIAAVKEAIAAAKKFSGGGFIAQANKIYFGLYHRTCQCNNCYYPSAGKWKI
ncbi:MAG: U32 family peptidase [Candidatus Diapherotrites archaeon]|nr:U32 family peptidase [Candidatus Diapherotrites archaeon]